MTSMGRALQAFMEVPLAKGQKSRKWLEIADVSRNALTAYWDTVQSIVGDVLVRSQRAPEERDYHLRLLNAGHDTDFLATVESQRNAVLSKLAQSAAVVPPPVSSSWSILGTPTDATSRPEGIAVRGKSKKLADTPTSQDLNADSAAPIQISKDSVVEIAVNADTKSVFDNVFIEDISEQEKIRWPRFVAAMIDAGFTAYCNGGSAVSFKSAAGRIAFHRPHPEPTLDSVMLQVNGKRLNKWFGWTEETFVMRKKVVV